MHNFALCTRVCSNFDSCAILNSQAPKIFCVQNNVDFLGNSEVAFFLIHPVQGVSKKRQPLNIQRYSLCFEAQKILGPCEFKMPSNRTTVELLIVISLL